MSFVPGKGQVLDVPVQVVSDGLYIGLRAFGQIEPLAEAAHAPEDGHCQHTCRRQPQGPQRLLPQGLPAQPVLEKDRQPGRFVTQDRVHGDLDDLGRQGVEGHAQTGAGQSHRKIGPAATQIAGDEPDLLLAGQLIIGFHGKSTRSFRKMGVKKRPLTNSEGATIQKRRQLCQSSGAQNDL